MDEDEKSLEVSPEEQKAEEEATREVADDELREKLAAELGVDPETDNELLDKLVERERANYEKLQTAIRQKRSWREKALQTSGKPAVNPQAGKNPSVETPDIDKLIDEKVRERLEERDLESLGLPEELKGEVKRLAKLEGISVREAAQLPYIQYRKQEAEKEQRIKNATPKRTSSGAYVPVYDPSKPLNPADFDLDTEEGRKAWQEAKAARAKYIASQQ